MCSGTSDHVFPLYNPFKITKQMPGCSEEQWTIGFVIKKKKSIRTEKQYDLLSAREKYKSKTKRNVMQITTVP